MTTIFREYSPSDAERSDRSAGDRLRHRQKVRESIRENIADIIAEESLHRGYFGILSRNDPYGDLAGARIVGTIECDRGDGIAAKAFATFLVER